MGRQTGGMGIGSRGGAELRWGTVSRRGAGKKQRGSRRCRGCKSNRSSFAPSRLRANILKGRGDLARGREDAKELDGVATSSLPCLVSASRASVHFSPLLGGEWSEENRVRSVRLVLLHPRRPISPPSNPLGCPATASRTCRCLVPPRRDGVEASLPSTPRKLCSSGAAESGDPGPAAADQAGNSEHQGHGGEAAGFGHRTGNGYQPAGQVCVGQG